MGCFETLHLFCVGNHKRDSWNSAEFTCLCPKGIYSSTPNCVSRCRNLYTYAGDQYECWSVLACAAGSCLPCSVWQTQISICWRKEFSQNNTKQTETAAGTQLCVSVSTTSVLCSEETHAVEWHDNVIWSDYITLDDYEITCGHFHW